MLCSYLKDIARDGSLLPNVIEIQTTIEQAWDNGICAYGRIESGGLRGTRKWIGTHDAVAYFTQIGVTTQASSFKEEDDGSPAVLSLLDFIEAYFLSGADEAKVKGTSHITKLAPVYFQRAGHSMTIVGLERREDGHRNLLVFDPSFGTSDSMNRMLDRRGQRALPQTLLRPYRRSDESLSRWDEFEVMM